MFDRINYLQLEVLNGSEHHEYHSYLSPPLKREQSACFHRISDEFLGDKPTFKQEAKTFLSFIKGHTLIAHNAKFDAMMLNSELERIAECQWYDSLKQQNSFFLANVIN